jgi:guanylate kinase
MTIGPLFILSGPSGSGKTTLIFRLLQENAWPMRLSVSVTTRARRPTEEDGVHYHFWPADRFLAARDRGEFLEWAAVYGNYYGTLAREVAPRAAGVGVWLDIDTQGWEQVRRRCPDAVSIFLRTSTMEVFERRLRERRTESEEAIARRLVAARAELARAPEYDVQVINDDLETALAELREVVRRSFEGGSHA